SASPSTLTVAYNIRGSLGFPAGAPLHEFTGNIDVKNLLASSNISLDTTHASDPDNTFSFNLGSGASATAEIFTNVPDIIFQSVVIAGERMRIKSTGTVPTTETTTSWTSYENPANLELYNDGQGSVADDDILGTIKFFGDTSGVGAMTRLEYGSIRMLADDSTEPSMGAEFRIDVLHNSILETFFRCKPERVNEDLTTGANISEVKLVTQDIIPNTSADIGHPTNTFTKSYIDEMHTDRILFDETEAPTRTDTSIGSDSNRIWLNVDSNLGSVDFTFNDGFTAEITHQIETNSFKIHHTTIVSEFQIFLNGGFEARFLNDLAPEFYFAGNTSGSAGNSHTRIRLVGDGFTAAGSNDDEILFDSENNTANDIVGQIHFVGHTDAAANFDIFKIKAKNQVPTAGTRSGLVEFEVARAGTENETFMIFDGFNSQIELYRDTEFNGAATKLDMGARFVEYDSMTAPSHTTATKRFLFVDTATNHLSVRTNTTVIDLESVAGGTSNLLQTSVHTDTTTDTVVRGDLVIGNSTPVWTRLAKGTANQVLSMDGTGTDVVWTSGAGSADQQLSNLSGTVAVNTDLDPSATGVRDLGNSTFAWDKLYASAFLFTNSEGVSAAVDSLGREAGGDIFLNVGGTIDNFKIYSNAALKVNMEFGLGSFEIHDSMFYEAQGTTSVNFIRMGVVDTTTGGINTNALLSLRINNVPQVLMSDGFFYPNVDNDIDLGKSGQEFRNLWIDGTANIDILQVDVVGVFTGALICNSTANFNSTVTLGDNTSDLILPIGRFAADLDPSADNQRDIGAVGLEWRNLFIDGIATIDTLQVDLDAVFDGNMTLGSSSADNITFNGDTVGNITPNVTGVDNLGGTGQRYVKTFLSNAVDIFELGAGQQPTIGTNRMALFCRPNGVKTEFRVRFQTGGTQLIATEP
ncbi:hypothetical protein LCGC14_1201640, partial [marine sediment metagenome]